MTDIIASDTGTNSHYDAALLLTLGSNALDSRGPFYRDGGWVATISESILSEGDLDVASLQREIAELNEQLEDLLLVRAAAGLSEQAFARVWDNDADDIYDDGL